MILLKLKEAPILVALFCLFILPIILTLWCKALQIYQNYINLILAKVIYLARLQENPTRALRETIQLFKQTTFRAVISKFYQDVKGNLLLFWIVPSLKNQSIKLAMVFQSQLENIRIIMFIFYLVTALSQMLFIYSFTTQLIEP